MKTRVLTKKLIDEFRHHLIIQEKTEATIEKYIRDVNAFKQYISSHPVTKEIVVEYKKHLQSAGYAVRSINSMIAGVNSILDYLGWGECKVKCIRHQRRIYIEERKELTKAEYFRLVNASKNDAKLKLIMETICSTGIRISELRYFTVESVRKGTVSVECKSKSREIIIPKRLKVMLLDFARCERISSGIIFSTRKGKPMNRSYIWAQMKRLCKAANVNPDKVFPHNLRKLFARTFYNIEKDIARLADILGHSSIDTTRIYIISTGTEHRRKIEGLGLIV